MASAYEQQRKLFDGLQRSTAPLAGAAGQADAGPARAERRQQGGRGERRRGPSGQGLRRRLLLYGQCLHICLEGGRAACLGHRGPALGGKSAKQA